MTEAIKQVAGHPQVAAIVQVYHPPGAIITQNPVTEDHTISVPDEKGDLVSTKIDGAAIKERRWGDIGEAVKHLVEKAGHTIHGEITWMSELGR
jgi:hypothetical protein